MRLTNANVFHRLHEIVTETEIGSGKGIGIEIAIGEMPHADGMELRHRGSGIENVREMSLRGDRTRRKKKKRNHQSRSLPLSLGLSARCLSRQSLMVGVNFHLLFAPSVKRMCAPLQVQCLEQTTCCKFLGTPSSQTSTDQGPPLPLCPDVCLHRSFLCGDTTYKFTLSSDSATP